MDVDGMKDASHMHKLRGPQAGRCREGWLVIVAGSGGSRHRDSRALRFGGPAVALAFAGEDISAPWATSDCRPQSWPTIWRPALAGRGRLRVMTLHNLESLLSLRVGRLRAWNRAAAALNTTQTE